MARILVIDDDALFTALMRRALEHRGHYVATAADAPGGRDCLHREAFDAVVCDIVLPGESGLSVLRELREKTAIALIAISGSKSGVRNTRPDVLQLAHTLGCDAIVRKPFELSNFVATVEAALAKKRQTAASGTR